MAIETENICASFMLENFDHLWNIPDNHLVSTIDIAKEITHLVIKKKSSSNTNKNKKLRSEPANTSHRMQFNQQKINWSKVAQISIDWHGRWEKETSCMYVK